MARSEEYFDVSERFSPSSRKLIPDFEDEDYERHDTQILNLEDGPDFLSVVPDSVLDPVGDVGEADEELVSPEVPTSRPGVLDEDIIADGLTNLGRCADGTQLAFLHLILPGLKLQDISPLVEYVHIQKLDISHNALTDLSPLGHMPYLLELDASNNQLTTLLDFNPPKNLKTVKMSFNFIREMPDLSLHHFLQVLILDNNDIEEITGLEECERLTHLSLAHNQISKMQGLARLPLKHLNLSHNRLHKIENLEDLPVLECLNLSANQIRSMDGLRGQECLECVDLEDNEIVDIVEVEHIKDIQMLQSLNLQRNPIRELPEYRLGIIFACNQLMELDKHKITSEEKVSAQNMFEPDLNVIAAHDHIMNTVYNFLQPSRIRDSTLPSVDTPYPILVLVGPQGTGKKDMTLKLVEEFPDYFGHAVIHTTRPQGKDEVDGRDHYFVKLEEFESAIKAGKFLQSYAYNGDLYGLSYDAIDDVAKEGLACIVHTELEGVLVMKQTHFEPRYVFMSPLNKECHEKRLRERSIFTEEQIQHTLRRPELYADYNQENPGFFDMFINTDDITDAYKKLRKLVMDYLGIQGQTPEMSEMDRENTDMLMRENTDTTYATSGNMVRTWSKISLADKESVQASKARNLQSPNPSQGRGFLEEQALERRKSALKSVVAGASSALYEQLIRQKPISSKSATGYFGQSDYPDNLTSPPKTREHSDLYRTKSAPTGNEDVIIASPDSSMIDDQADDTLSNISEARIIDAGQQVHGMTLPQVETASNAGSDSRPGSRHSGRPGSDRLPVLPPINGNKQ